MRERGQIADTGSRIEFVFTTIGRIDPKFNQGDKVESLEYFEKWLYYMRIDYLYYLEKQMMIPMDEILSVGLKTDGFMEKLFFYHYQHFLVTQHINSLKSNFEFLEDDIDIENKENKEKEKKSSKKPSEEFLHLSKNNSKKLWKFEEKYIESSENKYDIKQINMLKRLRGIKFTDTSTEKKKRGSKSKIDKILEIDDELIMSNYY